MSKRNEIDDVAQGLADELRETWKPTPRRADPVQAGTERLSARDYRNRIMQMPPEQQAEEYHERPDDFMRAIREAV